MAQGAPPPQGAPAPQEAPQGAPTGADDAAAPLRQRKMIDTFWASLASHSATRGTPDGPTVRALLSAARSEAYGTMEVEADFGPVELDDGAANEFHGTISFDATDTKRELYIDPKTGSFAGDMDVGFINEAYSPKKLETEFKSIYVPLLAFGDDGGQSNDGEAALARCIEFFVGRLPRLQKAVAEAAAAAEQKAVSYASSNEKKAMKAAGGGPKPTRSKKHRPAPPPPPRASRPTR
jgi:hypothetical protein